MPLSTLTVTPLDNLASAFSWITSRVGDIVATISGNPLLMIGLAIFTVGGVIGLGYRLIHGR